MANPVLFASSLFFAYLHLALILIFQPVPRLFSFTILSGVLSSIWNHGTTSELAKWSDRGAMAVGAAVDFAYIYSVPIGRRPLLAALIVAAIAGYAGAKALVRRQAPQAKQKRAPWALAAVLSSGDLPHLLAHACLSCTHFVMIVELASHCGGPAAAAAGAFCR
jgi:hypothetical protein